MFNISIGKTSLQNFCSRQADIQERQILVNALDTVDYESYNYNKKANKMHQLSLYVPTLACLLAYTKLAPKFKKLLFLQSLHFLLLLQHYLY